VVAWAPKAGVAFSVRVQTARNVRRLAPFTIGLVILSQQRPHHSKERHNMDKDRIGGVAKQAKGAVKEATGKALGDSKLVADGKSDKVEGKVQNAIGGLKDALKK
jgi:uncharacterized protein YjbJ (UPF0337 family)